MSQHATKRLMVAALLSALTIALSFLEGLLPPLPIPGAKLGLANLTVMVALCGVSIPCAAGVMVVKVAFALFRGPLACLMSAGGSVLALLLMALLHRLCRDNVSFVGLGVAGAVAHNAGQWCVAYALLGTAMTYYAPVLLLLAIPAGLLTGIVLNMVYPFLQTTSFFKKGR